MADKSIFELNLQTTFAPNDRLVIGNYANSDAEAITGQQLIALLAVALDGHGGIASIAKTSSSGTNPVVDTYTVTFADATTTTFTVTNGLKGDKGDQTYVWLRWAHTQPSSWSDTTSTPDDWMGIYTGTASTQPTSVSSYAWYEVKGEKGDTGDAASIVSTSVVYQASSSGTVVPSGTWSSSVPTVAQGDYLWTRTTITFNSGSPIVAYSVGRMGINGSGAVSTVNGISPDVTGNVTLTANDIGTSDSSTVQQHITDIESEISTIEGTASNKVLYLTNIACSATTGNFASVSNSAITANHVLAECVFANPSAIATDVDWTTASGSLVLNGTCSSATTANIVLIKKDN